MRIHIDQITPEGLVLEFEERPATFPVLAQMEKAGDCEFLTSIKTSLRAARIGDMVEVKGDVRTSVRLTCGRCLKLFETPLNSRLALTYTRRLPQTDADTAPQDVELTAAEIGLVYFRGEEINLQDGIQECAVMGFPLKALCKEACKGICARCGADLNAKDCGCGQPSSGSTFDALGRLKLVKK